MDGEHERRVGCEVAQRVDRPAEQRAVVDERGPVKRDEAEGSALEPERPPRLKGAGGVDVREERVDHRVADEPHPVTGDSLLGEVVDGACSMDEEQRAQVVREDAVVLLGHRPVVALQPSLEMRDGDVQLRRGKRARECQVDIAGHHHDLRSQVEQDGLDARERFRRLLCMAAGTDAEEDIGAGRRRPNCSRNTSDISTS